MVSCGTSVYRPLQMAESCLASAPTYFTTKNDNRFPLLPSKQSNSTHLYCSFSPSLLSGVSVKSKHSRFHVVPLVAQTSDWARQEEEQNSVAEEDSIQDSYPDPDEEAKFFVGNLPYDADGEKLAEIFNQAGIVEIAEFTLWLVIYNRETDRSRGFGFVTMSTVEEAEKAVEMFHHFDINGRLLTVNKAAPRGTRPERSRPSEPSFRIYVGNLAWQVDDACLEQVFSQHGEVVNARVVSDRETGRSRGFGFVTMSSETELNDAIAALDGQSLDGRTIRVNVAEQRRSSFSF